MLTFKLHHCQAEPQLNSTQFNSNWGWDGLYFHLIQPPTRPPTGNSLNSRFVLFLNTSLEIISTSGTILKGCHQIQWQLSRQHLTRQHLSILAISQLNQFGPNINSGFHGPSLPDAVCQGDICPRKICPGNICTYQQYILCVWPKFYQTFCTHSFCGKNFFWPKGELPLRAGHGF